jgi:hypothetical protein
MLISLCLSNSNKQRFKNLLKLNVRCFLSQHLRQYKNKVINHSNLSLYKIRQMSKTFHKLKSQRASKTKKVMIRTAA